MTFGDVVLALGLFDRLARYVGLERLDEVGNEGPHAYFPEKMPIARNLL